MARHEITIAANEAKIEILSEKIADLEKLDQSAVLLALKQHEIGAEARAEKTQGAIAESTSELRRIAGILQAQAT